MRETGPDARDTLYNLTPMDKRSRDLTQEKIADQMRDALAKIPGINLVMSQPISDRMEEMVTGVRADVAVKVFGVESRRWLMYRFTHGTFQSPWSPRHTKRLPDSCSLPEPTSGGICAGGRFFVEMGESGDAQLGGCVGNQRNCFERLVTSDRALRHGIGYAIFGTPVG